MRLTNLLVLSSIIGVAAACGDTSDEKSKTDKKWELVQLTPVSEAENPPQLLLSLNCKFVPNTVSRFENESQCLAARTSAESQICTNAAIDATKVLGCGAGNENP